VFSQIIPFKQTQTVPLTSLNFTTTLLSFVGIALFRSRLIDGWHAEVDSRKMSANLLADLDIEDVNTSKNDFGDIDPSLLTSGDSNSNGNNGALKMLKV